MILYNPTVSGSLAVTGSLTTTGTITSQTLVVQTITSSIEFNTGSTRNGTLLTNTHEFTGSVLMTGSLSVTTTGTELQVNASGVNIGNALTDNHIISGSVRINPNGLFVSSSGFVGIGTTSPSQLLEVVGGEIKAGRVDSSIEGGQVSFGRSTDNATSWYIDNYGNAASTQLRFVNVTNAVVAMTITGSNVGIGTSSPSSLLTVAGTIESKAATPVIKAVSSNSSNDSTIAAIWQDGPGMEMRYNPNTALGYIQNTYPVDISAAWGDIHFRANVGGTNTTRMIIKGYSGNVGIGNSNPTYKLDVNGEVVSRGSATAAYSYEDRNNTSLVYTMYAYNGLTLFYNGGNRAQINMTSGAYTALSDVNKKKDFEQSTIGLSEVLQLKPTLYRLKESEETSPKELGFIAQEVKDHIPQAYVESNMADELFIGLNQMPIIAALTKAIQELSSKNTALEEILQRNNIQ
jgi:hypothetical protein